MYRKCLLATCAERRRAGWEPIYAYVPTETLPNLCHRSVHAALGCSRGRTDNYVDAIQITEMIGERKDMCATRRYFCNRHRRRVSKYRQRGMNAQRRCTRVYNEIVTPISRLTLRGLFLLMTMNDELIDVARLSLQIYDY